MKENKQIVIDEALKYFTTHKSIGSLNSYGQEKLNEWADNLLEKLQLLDRDNIIKEVMKYYMYIINTTISEEIADDVLQLISQQKMIKRKYLKIGYDARVAEEAEKRG